MGRSERNTPEAPDPRAGANPGYAEAEPQTREDAGKTGHGKRPNPDVGGLDRKPQTDADPTRTE